MADHGSTRKIVTARKSYTCDWIFAHDRRIEPGDQYVRLTIFPNHDYLGDPAGRWGTPYQLRICAMCGDIPQ